MLIIETTLFTRLITRLMDDEHYRELQEVLIGNPDAGQVIPGSGGLRKIRWRLAGRGKRGGVRVIYYRVNTADRIYMLYVYAKNEAEDLTRGQLKTLRQIVERW
ncbi:MAG: type II toxin-antitoxin system RelE/ParE family toxin [Gammaproteobacteria bacterium]|nr:MAG: type II toxin-antitoxin system RelE/ParE family toxin [Gammaproteobacteria bacterium]